LKFKSSSKYLDFGKNKKETTRRKKVETREMVLGWPKTPPRVCDT
jgi:hypothetical protein